MHPLLFALPLTSNSLPGNAPHQCIQPIDMLLCLLDHNRVTLLKDLVYSDKRLERLHFIGEDGLPVFGVSSHHPTMAKAQTDTFIPAQKAAEDLLSHV